MPRSSGAQAPEGAEGLTYRSAAAREATLVVHGRRCRYCGRAATDVDHIVLRWRGGSDDITNLIAACDPCNTRKNRSALPAEVEAEILADALEVAPLVRELTARIRAARQKARYIRRGGQVRLAQPCTSFTLLISRASRDAFVTWCREERMPYREGFKRIMAAVRKGTV